LINQIKIRYGDRILMAKAEFTTGCILPDGSFLEKGKYQYLGTAFCHFCGHTENLHTKQMWYGKRFCCIRCKPKQPGSTWRTKCIWCTRKTTHVVVRDRLTAIKFADAEFGCKKGYLGYDYLIMMCYCDLHIKESPWWKDLSEDMQSIVEVGIKSLKR